MIVTTVATLLPGQTMLRKASLPRDYGTVERVERLTNRTYIWRDVFEITFTDGETKKMIGAETAILKD